MIRLSSLSSTRRIERWTSSATSASCKNYLSTLEDIQCSNSRLVCPSNGLDTGAAPPFLYHPSMRRALWFQPFAVVIGLWFALFVGDRSLVSPCAMHGAFAMHGDAHATASHG